MNRTGRIAIAAVLTLALPALASAGEHRIGFGYHYWKTLDDISATNLGQIDDNGYTELVSYQYLPAGLMKWEVDLEYANKGFGGSTDKAYSPQVFLLFGRNLYAGVGVGMTKSDGFANGDSWSDPWYAARAGIELLLLPKIHLDINANYRADAFTDLNDAKSDTITLGASVRLAF